MIKQLLFLLSFLVSSAVYAQIDTSQENITEAKMILKDIQSENNFRKGSFETKVGLMQLTANKPASPLQLNSSDQLPFIEFDGEYMLKKKLGLGATIQHAQNLMGTSSGTGKNSTSSYQQVFEFGPIYKYILDETNIKNSFTVKFQYYLMRNNFKLANTQLFYANSESGLLLGCERSVPATELIDLVAGFDFVEVLTVKSNESILEVNNKGTGLQLRANVYYNLEKTKRIGFGYSISAFFSKFKQPDFEGRDRHTQTYKALSINYSTLF